jgi:uncharacterized protein (TIGR02757 family)
MGTIINLQDIYESEKCRLVTLIGNDPVRFPHRFSSIGDIEIAGFIAAQFAYGRVSQITQFLERLFGRMAGGPYNFIASGDLSILSDLYYRFQKGHDIVRLFEVLRDILNRYGSIGAMISHYYDGELRKAIWSARADIIDGEQELTFFFPKPALSSPLKRWNLYTRWMVRRDKIDFGLWNFMGTENLVVPLDANIYKIGKCHGWTAQSTQTWKAATEITHVLKKYCSEDPLKYDFLLCHVVGIQGKCTGVMNPLCGEGCFSYEI